MKFQVHLYVYSTSIGVHNCGGSIIDDLYILTAAHCIENDMGITAIEIRVSEHSQAAGGDHVSYSAAGILPNPYYNSETSVNDNGVILLHNAIDFTEPGVAPVCLPAVGQTWSNGDQTMVSGWGLTESGGSSTPDILQVVNISFVDSTTCGSDYGYYEHEITSDMFCAYDQGAGTDSCQGDSGGPLAIYNSATGRWEQAGIVSWGIGCGFNGFPGVYSDVTQMLWWVNAIADYFSNHGDCLNSFQKSVLFSVQEQKLIQLLFNCLNSALKAVI